MGRPARARPVRHPVAVSLLAITSVVLPVFLTGALSVQLRAQLHFSSTALGALVATFFVVGVGGSLVAGPASERHGVAVVMRLSTATSACCLAAIAVLAHSAIVLGALLGVAGLANGLLQPSVNAFLLRAVRPGRQGLAFGMRQSAIPLSTLLGGLAVPALALTVGWRWAYAAAALLATATVALLPSPRQVAALEVRPAGGRPAASAPAAAGGPAPARRSRAARDSGIALAPLVVLAVGGALGAGAANALGAFLIPAAVAAHLGAGLAGWLAAGGSLCGLVTRVAIGARADRRGGGHLRVVSAMLLLGATGYLLLSTGRVALLVPATILAFAAGWGWNGLFNFAVARTHPQAAARATSVTQAGIFAGSVVVPLVFGVVVDHGSYGLAWLLDAGLVLAAALVVAVGRRLLVASSAASPGGATATTLAGLHPSPLVARVDGLDEHPPR